MKYRECHLLKYRKKAEIWQVVAVFTGVGGIIPNTCNDIVKIII
jgi:hypothetical protein